jgi:hypothetical protein
LANIHSKAQNSLKRKKEKEGKKPLTLEWSGID